MSNRLKEINERQTAIRAAVLELEQKVELDDEDVQAQEDLFTEHETLEAERSPLQEEEDKRLAVRAERLEKLIAVAQTADNRTPPTAGLTFFERDRHPDPYVDMQAVRSGMVRRADVKARALNAIERSAKLGEFGPKAHPDDLDPAEVATQKVQRSWGSILNNEVGNDVASYVLVTGNPEYQDAFRSYLENPMAGLPTHIEAVRTALSLTNAAGGFLLPYVLDPSIVLSNASSANPYRRVSRHETTTSNAWQGVNSAGVTAAWLAEGAASADASPAVGQIKITPVKGSAWIYGSYEVLADTDFASQLPVLIADARDRLEEAAFTTGNGTTTGPKGIITAATTLVNTATTLVYAIADVYATQAAVPARFRNAPGMAWIMNVAYINKTRQFDTAGGASFWTNLGKGQPETLLGAPIYESTTMFGAVQASGSKIAVAGDFGQYIIVDRVGVSVIYEPLVKDQATAFPTGQGGWFAFWRTGADVSTVNAFRVLNGL